MPDVATIPAMDDEALSSEFIYWFRVYRNEGRLKEPDEREYFRCVSQELSRRGLYESLEELVPVGEAGRPCTYGSIADEIQAIRYAEPGKIAFTFRGKVIKIKEPQDILLVGFNPEVARRWLSYRYAFILQMLPTIRLRE